jgi:6-phosphogluconolactonase
VYVPKPEVLPTPDAVARATADLVVETARRTLDEAETFTLCLAGGSTPRATYELLAGDEYRKRVEWGRVEIFFGDERCVPPDDVDSNYRMAREALLDHVGVPGDNIYRMRGELNPNEAADGYANQLHDRFGDEGGLDLLLLGMGADGHTLSLFPNTSALVADDEVCVENHVPKLDAWRITLTAAFANRSGRVAALVTGVGKAEAATHVLESNAPPAEYPMKLIHPAGPFTFFMDAAAAGM